MQVQAGGYCNAGQVRAINEDRYTVRTPRSVGKWDPLVMVADGMGGHQAGEVPSGLAVDQVVEVCEAAAEVNLDLEATLRQAIVEANETIRKAAAADPNLRGMGTTVTVALVHD